MISKKKDKVLDEYVKMIQSLKREYQTVYTEKNKLKDFLRKREKDRKREEQELLRRQHAKQMDIYSRMIAAQKKDKTLKEGGIMKVIAAIMMQKALKITTAVTKNEKRDPPKKLTKMTMTMTMMSTMMMMIKAKLKRNRKKEKRRKVS